jgi:BirA family biotin operon repressor/biotin-[acetyl-CoA-carboxylase] ligase
MAVKLTPGNLKERLHCRRIGKQIVVFDSTASTNNIASEYARNKDNDGMVVFAEYQTAGRGRSGNRWFAEKGKCILFSVVLCGLGFPSELLSLCTAVAIAEAVGTNGSRRARIKWPNDILLGGGKIAGILVESRKYGYGEGYILGVGVNCNQSAEDFPQELKNAATSLKIEQRRAVDRVSASRRIISSLDYWVSRAERNEDAVIENWKRHSMLLGERVTVICDGRQYCGNCLGVDPQKGLILQLEGGGIRMFDAGHTTVAW